MPSPSAATAPDHTPCTLSYLRRCASVAASVRSFTATTSMSAPRRRAARRKFRPMRPKPLIPTRTLMLQTPSPTVARRPDSTIAGPTDPLPAAFDPPWGGPCRGPRRGRRSALPGSARSVAPCSSAMRTSLRSRWLRAERLTPSGALSTSSVRLRYGCSERRAATWRSAGGRLSSVPSSQGRPTPGVDGLPRSCGGCWPRRSWQVCWRAPHVLHHRLLLHLQGCLLRPHEREEGGYSSPLLR